MNQDEVNIGQDCAFVLESSEIGEAHGELQSSCHKCAGGLCLFHTFFFDLGKSNFNP